METRRPLNDFHERLDERVFGPLRHTGRGFYIFVGVLLIVIAWGAVVYAYQLREGLIVTGMRDRVSWGLYISFYIYFIGASVGGLFLSTVLRVTQASWRAPITRLAEIVAIAAIVVEGLFILFNSRHDPHETMFKIIFYGRWESPVTWDVYGIITYMTGVGIYMFLALVPDMAYCRDRFGIDTFAPKRWFYQFLSIDWQNTPLQRHYQRIALAAMVVVMIPVAVMMRTVTSWLFAMTLREPWDSTLFGVFFISGAVFSGIGIIIVVMAVMRRVYHLEEFITERHFRNLGYILAVFAAVTLYFNMNEFATHGYKIKGDISVYLQETFIGDMAPVYWTYIWAGIVAPLVIILVPWTRHITGIVIAAILVNIGMIFERYLMVVGGLRAPLNPYDIPFYAPTWVEYSITIAAIAMFILLITVLLKLIPSVTVWEMLEEHEHEVREAQAVIGPAVPSLGGAGGAD